MKPIVWEEINDKPSNFVDLESGAYILEVVDATEDVDHKNEWDDSVYDQIVIRYDVAAGPKAGFFKANNKPDFTHEHEFKVLDDERLNALGSDQAWKYTPWQDKFLPAVKASNPGMHGISDVKQLVGCRFGAVLRHRLYTKRDGDEGNSLEIQAFYAAQDIADGKYAPAKDVDKRKKPEARPTAVPAAAYDTSDIPFL